MSELKILGTASVFLTAQMIASLDYWRDKLGFTANVWGDPISHAILDRDGFKIMLSTASKEHEIVPNWKINGIWNAYFWINDATALYDEYTKSGAIIDYKLHEKPYGVLEFGIQDLDGHDIAFGQDIN